MRIIVTKTQRRILLTCTITYFYCMLWMVLENIIYGAIINRTVDNIVMLAFIPVIWIASDKLCTRKKKEKKNG